MILDYQLRFSNAQAVTADAISENIVDTQGQAFTTAFNGASVLRDVGNGSSGLKVFCQVNTTFATTVSIIISLYTDADVAFGSPKTLWTLPAIPVATLVAGYVVPCPNVPTGCERYLALYYDVSTSATAGKFDAGLLLNKQENLF